jgi:hypothetical protein
LRRGAQVESVDADPDDAAAMIAAIESFDRHAPIDVLIATAPRVGFFAGLTPKGGLLDRMQLRERGRIAIVSALAGAIGLSGEPSLDAGQAALHANARSLRERLAPARPGVSVVRASRLAARIAARGRDPRLIAISPDRAAAAIRHGIERRQAVISFPAAPAIAMRALTLIPAWLREWPERERGDVADDATDEVPVARENLQGD